MSVFRNHKTSADRSASDRSRHKEKITRAIREGVHHIVSDESIIGQDGKKRIKIPVRGIKEYRLVHGSDNGNKKVGSAPGKKIRRGQKVGNSQKKKSSQGSGKASNEKGEDLYEVEITLEELSYYLFDSLELPDLEKKKFSDLVSEKYKRKGYRKQGIRPRLSKKETLKNKIRRKKASERILGEEIEDFSFHESDLKYKHIQLKKKENTNAVLFFIMDTSGSMTKHKKFMARSFFFLLYHFIRNKYESTEIVFISHSVDAKEVTEDDFFKKASSGGTLMSSGLEKCVEIVDKRYHPSSWNIYTFHCSDGDNWIEDNEKAISLSSQLKDLCQMYCYIQIGDDHDGGHFWSEGGMAKVYLPLVDNKFKIVKMSDESSIWKEFKKLFGGKI